MTGIRNKQWLNHITFRVDFPVFFIKIKFRYQINQFHVGFPIRAKSPHILPIAIKFVGKQPAVILETVGNNMLSKVTVALVFQFKQRIPKHLPGKDINSHGSQIAPRILWFFLKLCNFLVLICNHDTKPACFLNGYRHRCNCDIRFIRLMEIQHHLIIHLINVVAGQNQNILRIIAFHITEILVNGIRRSRIPLAVVTFLIRRKYCHTTIVPVKIPRNPDSNVRIQTQRLILGQYPHRINA